VTPRPDVSQIPFLANVLAAMSPVGQTLPSRDFCGTAALPLKPDIARRGWHGRKVPLATECSAANYSITSSAQARSVGGTSKETIVQASARLDPNCPQTMIR
jgi:hypothetical protein